MNSFGDTHRRPAGNQPLGPNVNGKRERSRLPELSFRYAANRSLTLVQEDHAGRYPHTEGLDKTYARLQPLMQKRHLLPDDRGVRWESDAGQALFAFKAFDLPLPARARAFRVEAGEETEIDPADGRLRTEPCTAYRLGGEGGKMGHGHSTPGTSTPKGCSG